jgi:hypothetical protein
VRKPAQGAIDRAAIVDEQLPADPAKRDQLIKPTPIASLRLLGRDRFVAVGDAPVKNWAELRAELRRQTDAARSNHAGTTVELTIEHPTPGNSRERVKLNLEAAKRDYPIVPRNRQMEDVTS